MASLQEIFENETPNQRKRRLHNERQAHYHYKKKQKTKYKLGINLIGEQHINIERHKLKRMDQICTHCGAKFWIDEKDHNSSQISPLFAMCCAGGKVSLPLLLKLSQYLLDLQYIPHQILMQLHFIEM